MEEEEERRRLGQKQEAEKFSVPYYSQHFGILSFSKSNNMD
jgi:hypothetical protein